jgi:hypothetical protein
MTMIDEATRRHMASRPVEVFVYRVALVLLPLSVAALVGYIPYDLFYDRPMMPTWVFTVLVATALILVSTVPVWTKTRRELDGNVKELARLLNVTVSELGSTTTSDDRIQQRITLMLDGFFYQILFHEWLRDSEATVAWNQRPEIKGEVSMGMRTAEQKFFEALQVCMSLGCLPQVWGSVTDRMAQLRKSIPPS